MLTLHPAIFDDVPGDTWSRHLFIDAEPTADGWGVVVRGEDKRVIGRTNKPWEAELAFNDTAGDYRRFIVATLPDAEAARALAGELRDVFTSTDPFSARFARCSSPGVLAVLLSRFSAHAYTAGNLAGRRCGSFADRRPRGSAQPAATEFSTVS